MLTPQLAKKARVRGGATTHLLHHDDVCDDDDDDYSDDEDDYKDDDGDDQLRFRVHSTCKYLGNTLSPLGFPYTFN